MQIGRAINLIRRFSVSNTIFNNSEMTRIKFNWCNTSRQFHSSRLRNTKVFTEVENAYNYRILDPNLFRNFPIPEKPKCNIIDEISFNKYLNKKWREKNIIEIIEAFKQLKSFCIKHNINISDIRFDQLVDGLMDNCEKMNENQLIELLQCLIEYPMCAGIEAHNFHDVWSCLDDISCTKIYNNQNIDQLFAIADLWYKWNLAKVSDFIFILLDRLIRKSNALNKDQLVRVFFYFAVCRKRNVDFEYEYALQQKIHEMNINQLAVIASGYFKSRTKIKTPLICQTMIQSVIDNYSTIHEMSLCSIAKALRNSHHNVCISLISTMLDKLNSEFERFSNICCIHLMLLPTTYFLYHEESIRKSIKKLHPIISTLRLKDLERILLVLTTFNFPSEELERSKIIERIYNELHETNRHFEIDKYIKVLPAALNYLSLKGIYSYELSDRVLKKEFWSQFGKGTKNIPRELLSLDYCLEIDCRNYTGNRLPNELRNKAIRWYTEFTPFEHKWKKIKANDQLFLDVVDTIKQIIKINNENYLFIHHILPHFSKADIILCKNLDKNIFVEPKGLENYTFGDVMRPPSNDNNNSIKWYAIMLIGWNNIAKNTGDALGHILMKERQLKTIGYNPVKVFWNEFIGLTKEDRINYIKSKLI